MLQLANYILIVLPAVKELLQAKDGIQWKKVHFEFVHALMFQWLYSTAMRSNWNYLLATLHVKNFGSQKTLASLANYN